MIFKTLSDRHFHPAFQYRISQPESGSQLQRRIIEFYITKNLFSLPCHPPDCLPWLSTARDVCLNCLPGMPAQGCQPGMSAGSLWRNATQNGVEMIDAMSSEMPCETSRPPSLNSADRIITRGISIIPERSAARNVAVPPFPIDWKSIQERCSGTASPSCRFR